MKPNMGNLGHISHTDYVSLHISETVDKERWRKGGWEQENSVTNL